MPGGPAASGPGLGANAPKSKLAGILMVSFAAFAAFAASFSRALAASFAAFSAAFCAGVFFVFFPLRGF